MRTLVVGANGLLGSNVVATGREYGHDVIGTYHSTPPAFDIPLERLDVRNSDRFGELLDIHEPDAVLNCAAMTDVDECEIAPDEAYAVNAEAPGNLAEQCADSGATFGHISTDYVFDGTAEIPYDEEDDSNPRQVYGKSKLVGERAATDAHSNAVVARLSFVYGIHRGTDELVGFPAWVRDRLQAGEPTSLFTDQHVTPTRAGQAAMTLFELLDTEFAGTVHVACRDCITPFAFGDAVRQRLDVPAELLEESTMADVDRTAERPAYTCLDIGRVESVLDRPQPTLDADLAAIESAFRT